MDILWLLAILSGLFVAIALAEPVAERLRLPVSVIHALTGIGIGAGAGWLYLTPLTDALSEPALAILTLPISSEVFLVIFLPVLLFEVALTINLRRMLDDWVPILALAVLAVVAATLAIGTTLAMLTALPLTACMLAGSIVSTTDPSAVISIFRGTPAPQRLARIVEGESLLNDAAAIALFSVFLADLVAREATPDVASALWDFPGMVAGGVVVGAIIGRLGLLVMARLNAFPAGQVTLSLALPFATVLIADRGLHVSGVVAVVAAGMSVNFGAPGRIAPQGLELLRQTWQILAHWAGSLIFVLAALLVPRLLSYLSFADIGLILATAAAALLARGAILFGLLPVLTLARLSPRVELPYRTAILWGGLRGAVTLALALSLTERTGIPLSVKRGVASVAVGFTLFTLFVQGTTLRRVISMLGLDRLSDLDRALSDQVVAVALQDVRETVAETTRSLALTPAIIRDEAKRFGGRLNAAVDRADAARGLHDKDRVTLSLVALAEHERDLLTGAFRDGLIPPRLAERLLTHADRLMEATRTDGRSGYRAQSRRALRPGRLLRPAVWLHNRLGLSAPLAHLTANRFEELVAESQVLKLQHAFINRRILRIHGRRVADLLHDLLHRRADDLDKEIEGLRLQFPGYAERLERQVIRSTALMQEQREYDQLSEDGLIGPELRASLMAELGAQRQALLKRPKLDLALQKSDLVALFPLFAGMSASERSHLSAVLRTIYAAPGDRLMRQDEMPHSVWFIASGAVEMVQGDRITRLGRGDSFGELSLLLRRPRRARVTAITHCTLLALDEARFLGLIGRNQALRDRVIEKARARGVDIDRQILDAPPKPPGPALPAWIPRPSLRRR